MFSKVAKIVVVTPQLFRVSHLALFAKPRRAAGRVRASRGPVSCAIEFDLLLLGTWSTR
jgi:hypothetical protein